MKPIKKVIMIAFIATGLPSLKTNAQDTRGVRFEKTLGWQEIVEKAKAEHRYIFVDCFATWCGPCKMMDQDVYVQTNVGAVLNDHFISVKVQMDQTAKDDEQTKSWYKAAAMLAAVYKVDAYPTFLFFDPDGKPVSKATGAMNATSFSQLANDVRDPNKQFHEVSSNFRPNSLDTGQEKGIANLIKGTDHALAGKIAADYLSRIPTVQLSKSSNCQIMWELQDNPEVAAMAVKAIKNSNPKDNIEFIKAVSKQPAVIEWAAGYLSGRSKTELAEPTNLRLMVDFQGNPQVIAIAIHVIESDVAANLDLVGALAKQPAIIGWVQNYVQTHPLSARSTQQLAAVFNNDRKTTQSANHYINNLSENELYTHDNIDFTKAFTDTLAGRGFELFFRHGTKVDTIMHDPNYARGVLNTVVAHQLIKPATEVAKKDGGDPDWTAIAEKIKKKFGQEYVTDNLPYAQQHWYAHKKDGANYAKYTWLRLDNVYKEKGSVANSHLSPADWWNEFIYPIFQYDQNKAELEQALVWMHEANQLLKNGTARCLDTEAELLYKLGRKDKAIAMETQAAKLDPGERDIAEALKKMQTGQPTWSLTGVME